MRRDAGLEAAATAGFVKSIGSDEDEVGRFDEALGVLCRVATAHADGEGFGDRFGEGEEFRDGRKGAAQIVCVEPGNDHLFTGIGELLDNLNEFGAHEVGLIDAHYLGSPVEFGENFRSVCNDFRFEPRVCVGDNFVGRVALINDRFEDLNPTARDHGTAKAADEFFTFPGEHGATDDFNPAGVIYEKVHAIKERGQGAE